VRTSLIAALAGALALPAAAQDQAVPLSSIPTVEPSDNSVTPAAPPPEQFAAPPAIAPPAPSPSSRAEPEKKAKKPDMVETAGGAVGGVLGSTAGAVGGPLGSAAAGMVGNRVGRGTVGLLKKVFGGKKKTAKDAPVVADAAAPPVAAIPATTSAVDAAAEVPPAAPAPAAP
jgi:hypothetical protein